MCAWRSVMTPEKGAVTLRYFSISSIARTDAWCAAMVLSSESMRARSASTAFSARTTSMPATTPGVLAASESLRYVLSAAASLASDSIRWAHHGRDLRLCFDAPRSEFWSAHLGQQLPLLDE